MAAEARGSTLKQMPGPSRQANAGQAPPLGIAGQARPAPLAAVAGLLFLSGTCA